MIKLEQYRDPWLAEKVDEFIGFYPREFFVFDNFSSFRVLVDGTLYCTVEHAYQAIKFLETAPEIAEQITNCYSAHAHKKLPMQTRISNAKIGMISNFKLWKNCCDLNWHKTHM